MKLKKPKASEPSTRDKLSAAFLKAFQSDFDSFGIKAIEKLREENPAKYAEIASRLIAMVEPPLEGFEGCRTPRDLGIALLKSVGANDFELTEEAIEEAIKCNDNFIDALQAIRAAAEGAIQ